MGRTCDHYGFAVYSVKCLRSSYAKSRQEDVPAHILKALREELVDGYE